jgi:hypothetical protein
MVTVPAGFSLTISLFLDKVPEEIGIQHNEMMTLQVEARLIFWPFVFAGCAVSHYAAAYSRHIFSGQKHKGRL